jgi:hypothetical protein
MQTNIMMTMVNARATEMLRATMVLWWDGALTPKEVQPVGRDEMSKSSENEGGGRAVPPGSLMSPFALSVAVAVDGGVHGILGEKGELSVQGEGGQ